MSADYKVHAVGQGGDARGTIFEPYRERDGSFAIFSEALQKANFSDLLQKAENKVPGITTIADAVCLMRSGGHRWRLRQKDKPRDRPRQSNIFRSEHLVIQEC